METRINEGVRQGQGRTEERTREGRGESQLCHVLAVGSEACYSASRGLGFLIREMGRLCLLSQRVVVRVKGEDGQEALGWGRVSALRTNEKGGKRMNEQTKRREGEREEEKTAQGLPRLLSPSSGGQTEWLSPPCRLSLFDFGREIRCPGCFFISLVCRPAPAHRPLGNGAFKVPAGSRSADNPLL